MKIGAEAPTQWGRQAYVKARTGLPQPTISRIVRKERPGFVRIPTLDQIAKYLDLKTWQVVHLIETGTPPPINERVKEALESLKSGY